MTDLSQRNDESACPRFGGQFDAGTVAQQKLRAEADGWRHVLDVAVREERQQGKGSFPIAPDNG